MDPIQITPEDKEAAYRKAVEKLVLENLQLGIEHEALLRTVTEHEARNAELQALVESMGEEDDEVADTTGSESFEPDDTG